MTKFSIYSNSKKLLRRNPGRKLLLTGVLFLFASLAMAQPVAVKGKVSDSSSGEAIVGANVV
ncbi:MAG TPA: hypothetical protein PK167_04820, partial [Prolixibacteraceae bacterium]|nr:hypothetical protein [Prolixibacteraceae bacterium]